MAARSSSMCMHVLHACPHPGIPPLRYPGIPPTSRYPHASLYASASMTTATSMATCNSASTASSKSRSSPSFESGVFRADASASLPCSAADASTPWPCTVTSSDSRPPDLRARRLGGLGSTEHGSSSTEPRALALQPQQRGVRGGEGADPLWRALQLGRLDELPLSLLGERLVELRQALREQHAAAAFAHERIILSATATAAGAESAAAFPSSSRSIAARAASAASFRAALATCAAAIASSRSIRAASFRANLAACAAATVSCLASSLLAVRAVLDVTPSVTTTSSASPSRARFA
eukprot:CAMPEP_0181219592 /NCGR_PEP_ID=MMETSP1096-20121128/28368_1 /TAXON_ID=156174 ORGANISM="Chrysochromulina ericina, Strain CCMP281" /NCGR_SAMPLE_ID=MMETSP1096 /ASSEMBLY_ACC=CAM_ASM_000453 /LENGTH=294 /DNA_ID=CAMNT_0023312003 /DNA_START=131 /DNA_END=1014 /DNA_ORIENTATION=-